ncbi:MAG TPA: hypothetical protein PK926_09630 [Spirochaetota bacterium]|nr:hypothetical protein [Spirochaetota bacterium]HPI90166.1 hypothetical protein [Spirochaetota bacterium]HPR48925.1 hypothetical protein [Spirochaetota bacterium]
MNTKRSLFTIILVMCAVFFVWPVSLYSSGINIISDYLIRDLTRQYMAVDALKYKTVYISVIPFKCPSGEPSVPAVSRELYNALCENLASENFFTMIDSGNGFIHIDKNYRDPESDIQKRLKMLTGKKENRHCYITGSVSDDSFGYIARVDLIDAESGRKIGSKSVRIFHEDLKSEKKKKSSDGFDAFIDSISLDLDDSYMQSPLNTVAWLNDIYVDFSYIHPLRIKLGITNTYLELNDDLSLLSNEVYPHFMTSPEDGLKNFDPVVYTQFTQLAIQKCVPFIGVSYSLKINDFASVNLNYSTSIYRLDIPMSNIMSVNPYADLLKTNEDAARVFQGGYDSSSDSASVYPQVMFRLEVEPEFSLTENGKLGFLFSYYYTPLKYRHRSISEDDGDVQGQAFMTNPLFFPGDDLESQLLFVGSSIPLMGFSFRVSYTCVF